MVFLLQPLHPLSFDFFARSIYMLERFQVLLPRFFIFATAVLVFAIIPVFDFFAGSILLLEPLYFLPHGL